MFCLLSKTTLADGNINPTAPPYSTAMFPSNVQFSNLTKLPKAPSLMMRAETVNEMRWEEKTALRMGGYYTQ